MSLKIELFPSKATGTGLDGLNREDFKTDEAFLEAATRRQMELDDPAYRKAKTKVVNAYREQLQQEAKTRRETEFAEAVKACKLSQSRQHEIEGEAAKLAVADFEGGRISATEVDNQKRKYTGRTATEKRQELEGKRAAAIAAAQGEVNRLHDGKYLNPAVTYEY